MNEEYIKDRLYEHLNYLLFELNKAWKCMDVERINLIINSLDITNDVISFVFRI